MAYANTPPHFAQLGFGGEHESVTDALVARIIRQQAVLASALGIQIAKKILRNEEDVAPTFARIKKSMLAERLHDLTPLARQVAGDALTGILLFSAAQSVFFHVGGNDLPDQQAYNTYYYATLGQQSLTHALYNSGVETNRAILNASPNLFLQNPVVAREQWTKFFRGALAASVVARCLSARGGICYLPETSDDQVFATDLIYTEFGRGLVVQVKTGRRTRASVVNDGFIRALFDEKSRRSARALLCNAQKQGTPGHPFTALHVVVKIDKRDDQENTKVAEKLVETWINIALNA
jgi:hypothetical protein